MDFAGQLDGKGRNEFLVPDLVSPIKLCAELLSKSPSPKKNATTMDGSASQRNFSASPGNSEMQIPLLKVNNIARTGGCVSPVAEETNTPPLANITKNSSSKDWLLSSGGKSETVEQVRNFKRLRKVGDTGKKWNPKCMKENSLVPIANLDRSFSGISPNQVKHGKGRLYSCCPSSFSVLVLQTLKFILLDCKPSMLLAYGVQYAWLSSFYLLSVIHGNCCCV